MTHREVYLPVIPKTEFNLGGPVKPEASIEIITVPVETLYYVQIVTSEIRKFDFNLAKESGRWEMERYLDSEKYKEMPDTFRWEVVASQFLSPGTKRHMGYRRYGFLWLKSEPVFKTVGAGEPYWLRGDYPGAIAYKVSYTTRAYKDPR